MVSRFRAAFACLKPQFLQGKARLLVGGAFIGGIAESVARRLGRIDIVPQFISCVDAIEAGLRWIIRLGRALLARSGLPLTGAFAWRAAVVLGGIGLTTALITGLSAKDEDQLLLASLSPITSDLATQDGVATRRPRPPAAVEDWVVIPRPGAMFGLDAPELGREPPSIEVRRSPDGSRREDLLSFGSLSESKPHLLLRLATGAAAGNRPFTIALVHDAARHSLAVERSSTPASFETRFGPFEAADVLLGNGKQSRSCIAFRSRSGEAGFAVSGWWCAAQQPGDRRQLACLIEALDLGNDAGPELRGVFARSETATQPECRPPRASASGHKTSWLDADGAGPALQSAAGGTEIIRTPPERRKPRPKPVPRKP